ncbi:Hsp20/alpha crystallin family protein [Candidatus Bathyarchaeota archaeon]|nr:Hsp20/alpha crystallin family protein [Candidatus Bathyarchaeota archaeon]
MFDNWKEILSFDEMKKYIKDNEAVVNDILKTTFSEGPSWNTETCCLYALSNIFITPKEVILTADLPNIRPETVDVVIISSNFIEITAKLKKKVRFNDLGIQHRHGEFSFLRCKCRINVDIDAEKMKISCLEGILEVRVPRRIGKII